MGRVMAFIALAITIGVATGVLLERVLVGMLVGGGILLLGILLVVSRANRAET
jgi:hypothetical protein